MRYSDILRYDFWITYSGHIEEVDQCNHEAYAAEMFDAPDDYDVSNNEFVYTEIAFESGWIKVAATPSMVEARFDKIEATAAKALIGLLGEFTRRPDYFINLERFDSVGKARAYLRSLI